jgi:glyoxylase-like metal-dependent hydrolase (beta-lactamase superfamily II)
LQAIYTPGHLEDHMSFALKTKSEGSYLISGDIILGSQSAVVNDLDLYLKNLKMLQNMKFDFLLLPHSVGLETEQIIVDAKTKLHDYITYRETRLNELLQSF